MSSYLVLPFIAPFHLYAAKCAIFSEKKKKRNTGVVSTRISKQKEAKDKLALFLSLSAFPGQLSPTTDPEEKRRGATQVSFAARFTVKGLAPLAQEAILSYIYSILMQSTDRFQ